MEQAWVSEAIDWLHRSLVPLPQELNAIDWKSGLSSKTERLAQHLSAFANRDGGGFLAFGLTNDGTSAPLTKEAADEIVHTLANIARHNLSEALTLNTATADYNGLPVLLVKIPEARDRPVHLRSGDIYAGYKRSAGHTEKMSRADVAAAIANSKGQSFEEGLALSDLPPDEVLYLLDYDAYFRLLKIRLPETKQGILSALAADELIFGNDKAGLWNITNKGALLFAKDITGFKSLRLKSPRLIVYEGSSRIQVKDGKDIEGKRGYASAFESLLDFLMNELPAREKIKDALRLEEKVYPKVAIREFLANALVHQDLTIAGSRVMIEIFPDRIEITNPGAPLMDTNRFIDAQPKSRNTDMADMMHRLRICELRGSGIDRAIKAIEEWGLPAPKFVREEDYTRVIIYGPRPLERMSIEDRVRACFQHTALHYVNNELVTNASVRERFGISKHNHSMASKILSDTVTAGLIKYSDPDNTAKRAINYLPYWA